MTDRPATLVAKLARGHGLSPDEYAALIDARTPALADELAGRAREVCEAVYGDGVFARGLIEFTNICATDCYYCGIRRSNRTCERYRLTREQILACAEEGWQAGFRTNSSYGDARIKRIDTERVLAELDKNTIVIVTGFQGVDRNGDVTTLGRGGSDTSAVALAAAFRADLCQIYTDVDGVYTTDPRIVPSARKLDEITYDEMLELASQGAQVLHNRSVELAKKFRVNLEVVSSLERKPGTKVKEVTKVEKTNIAGVAKDTSIARVALIGLQHNPGVAFQVFDLLSKHNINVDVILQSIGREDTKDITFTVHKKDLEESKQILEEHKETLRFDHIETDESIGKVSIVGAGLMSNCGVAARMFEALYEAGINIQMINTSEIRVSVLLDEEDVNRAVRAIHDKFFGEI